MTSAAPGRRLWQRDRTASAIARRERVLVEEEATEFPQMPGRGGRQFLQPRHERFQPDETLKRNGLKRRALTAAFMNRL